jgi:hypothetical protein
MSVYVWGEKRGGGSRRGEKGRGKMERTYTIKKLNSQFEQVLTALALALVLKGLISAGYNQGSGNQVAPKKA